MTCLNCIQHHLDRFKMGTAIANQETPFRDLQQSGVKSYIDLNESMCRREHAALRPDPKQASQQGLPSRGRDDHHWSPLYGRAIVSSMNDDSGRVCRAEDPWVMKGSPLRRPTPPPASTTKESGFQEFSSLGSGFELRDRSSSLKADLNAFEKTPGCPGRNSSKFGSSRGHATGEISRCLCCAMLSF